MVLHEYFGAGRKPFEKPAPGKGGGPKNLDLLTSSFELVKKGYINVLKEKVGSEKRWGPAIVPYQLGNLGRKQPVVRKWSTRDLAMATKKKTSEFPASGGLTDGPPLK